MFFGRWKEQERVNSRLSSNLKALDNSLNKSFTNVKDDIKHIKQWINYLHKHHDSLYNSVDILKTRFDDLVTKEELKYFVDEYYAYLDTIQKSVNQQKQEMEDQVSVIYSNQQSVFSRLQHFSEIINNKKTPLLKEEMTSLASEAAYRAAGEKLNSSIDLIADKVRQRLSDVLSEKADSNEVFSRLENMNQLISQLSQKVEDMPEKTTPKRSLKDKVFKKVTRHSKEYVKSMLISLIRKYNKISGLNLREIVVEEQGIVSKSSFYRLLNEIEEDENINVFQEGKEKHYAWATGTSPEQDR